MSTIGRGLTRLLGPLQLRQFRLQFAAQALSMVGSTLSPVALSLGILTVTGSARTLSVVLAAGSLPLVAFVLVGGVWADRLPRGRIMVVANLVSACAQAGLGAMLLTGQVHLWMAVGLQILNGTAMAFYFPSINGLTAETVPADQLQKANALLSLTRSVSGSVGPLMASLLVLAGSAGWALVFDGATFVISAALLSRLTPAARDESGRQPFLRELAEGFREVVRRGWVWSSIGVFMNFQLVTAAFMVLGPVTILHRGASVTVWGATIACLSVGSVIGDALALKIVPRRPIVTSRLVELLAAPVLIAYALNAPVWLLVATATLAGIALTFPDALWFTALQRNLDPAVLSRVSSYDWLGSLALRPVGYLVAAAMAAAVGATVTLIAAAALLVASQLAGLLLRDVRALTSAAPERSATKTA